MTNEKSDSIRDFTVDDVVGALANQEFFLVYQPEFDLKSNAFVGVEALLRWRHPNHGVVLPDEFLSLLEESGNITAVGRWTLVSACAQGREWHDMGYRFSVSVNISPRQIRDEEFVTDVASAITISGFTALNLVLEIPQRILAGGPVVIEHLEALRTLGIRIAVDDIELEQEVVALLESTPIDIVKLDRQFVARMSEEPMSSTLESLVDMARAKNLQVVAAGVEDAEQRQLLQFGHVGIGQGYHFSKPREAVEINQMLLDFSIFSGKPLYTE